MNDDKPLATLAIFFYNQESFVVDAVNGALSQDYDNLEIVFSDDCSTDNTYAIIQRCVENYSGPHRIILNRNSNNLGISSHFNKVLHDYFNGEFLIGAGGDDISFPSRVSESVGFLLTHPNVQSLTGVSVQVDENLCPIAGLNDNICGGQISIFSLDDYCRFDNFLINSGESRAFRKQVIDAFPPLGGVEEDLETFLRCLLVGEVAILRTPLVKRRIHGNNVSKKVHSVAYRIKQKKQLINDVQYALDNSYINELQYERVKNKIDDIIKRLINVDNSKRHPMLYGFFYSLSQFIMRINNVICRL